MIAVGDFAQAAMLMGWRFDSTTNQLEIMLQDTTTPQYFLLSDPPRLVVDLPTTELGVVETQQNFAGRVRQIRAAQFTEDAARIVMEFSPEVQLVNAQITATSNNRWIVRPVIETATSSPSLAETALPPASFDSSSEGITVKVPPLQISNPPSPNIPTIEFGQPLPKEGE